MNRYGVKQVVWLCIIFSASYAHAVHEWSWVYHEQCTPQKIAAMQQRIQTKNPSYIFERVNIPQFSQLICSWNAFRPPKGHFAFFVQSREAKTGAWGTWHHMADWGADVQRSYMSDSDGVTSYHYVRLQTANKKYCDGFRIKAVCMDGAWVGRLKNLTVSTANFDRFKAEGVHAAIAGLSSVHVTGVPRVSQRLVRHSERSRICSPTSCTMVTRFLTGKPINTAQFVDNVFDAGLGVYGSWPFNMAHAFECAQGKIIFCTRRLNTFSMLHAQLNKGMPVVVSVRGKMKGAHSAYANGHLMVVVGWDARKREVLCHDPSFKAHLGIFKRYKIGDFLRAWEASNRLVYWAQRPEHVLIPRGEKI